MFFEMEMFTNGKSNAFRLNNFHALSPFFFVTKNVEQFFIDTKYRIRAFLYSCLLVNLSDNFTARDKTYSPNPVHCFPYHKQK